MGIVSQHLQGLLAKQVEDNGIVVWFDPEKHYEPFVRSLVLPEVAVVCYEGSFFALRHKVDSYLAGEKPARLVVYVPTSPEASGHALVEMEAAGAVLSPGRQPPARNTRLSVVARNALKDVLGDATAQSLEPQIDAGKLSLDDLDALADKGKGISQGVVPLVFGTADTSEIALLFLAKPALDTELEKKTALPELSVLLQAGFGLNLAATETLPAWRARLARHVLLCDLLASIQGAVPAKLASIQVAGKASQRDACVQLARHWRMRSDLRATYVEAAAKVESDLGCSGLPFEGAQLAEVETFSGLDTMLQGLTERAMAVKPTQEMVELARRRMRGFWADWQTGTQARWALIVSAGQLLLECRRVEQSTGERASAPADELLSAYTEGEQPWCLLDTFHRQMEARYQNYDAGDAPLGVLEQLIKQARQRYIEVADHMTGVFLRRWRAASFCAPLPRQREVFNQNVKPALATGKTAYVLVDALRYEMARELARTAGDLGKVMLSPAIGTPSTITLVGMAALLPGAEETFEITSPAPGEMVVSVGGVALKDRKDRLKYMRERAGVSCCDIRLDDLLPHPTKKVRDSIAASELVIVTSQEIDLLGEGDSPTARIFMEQLISRLKRGVQALLDAGVANVILAADHGFIYGDELGDEMKIDPPGGMTADLHQRVWVGQGGGLQESVLRVELDEFSIAGGLELATPLSLGGFKVPGGGKAYCHGGLSLQELVIPVLTISGSARRPAEMPGDIRWELLLGAPKITTRFFSVQIKGLTDALLPITAPRIRLELRSKSKVVSRAISSSYGFEDATGEVQLHLQEGDGKAMEPNTVTLQVTEEIAQKTASLHLLDAVTGAELIPARQIEVSISI